MKYLDDFFNEKDIEPRTFEVKHDGTVHLVDNAFLIEVICQSTPRTEQEQIAGILRQIDFKNGDVNHFLAHLAEGYVKNNY